MSAKDRPAVRARAHPFFWLTPLFCASQKQFPARGPEGGLFVVRHSRGEFMQPLRIFSIIPKLPPDLEPLWFLAHNYWFAWNNDIEDIFSEIDSDLWIESYKNPVWMLNHVPQERYDALAADSYFKNRLAMQVDSQQRYLAAPSPYKFEDVPPGSPAIA
jgi:hypothetical protein